MLYLIDQRRLPDALVEYPCRSAGEVAFAIREMVVRGAPALGQVAAIGLAMSAENQRDGRPYARQATIRGSANALINARPTAVNVRWAVERVLARYVELDELSEDGEAIADAMRAEADAIVFEATTDHGRLAEFGLRDPPDARGPGGPDPHPLQHRAAGVRPVRDRARRRPGRAPRRACAPRLGRRDAAVPPGRAADHLGAGPGRRPAHAARRRGRRPPHGARRGGRRPRRRRPGRRERRYREQDRHVPAGRARGPARGPVLRLRADELGRPRDGGRDGHPDRGASSDELLEFRGVRVAPPGTEVRNPAFDVTPAELITGIVTEEGVVRAPFEAGLRDASEAARARWAAVPGFRAIRPSAADTPPRRTVTRRPRRTAPRRRRPRRGSTDGHGRRRTPRRDRRARDDRQGRSCGPSSSTTACSPRTRSATSRTASSRGRAGASRGMATTRWRSSSSTAG